MSEQENKLIEGGLEKQENSWEDFYSSLKEKGEALGLRFEDSINKLEKITDTEKKNTFSEKAKRLGMRIGKVVRVAALMSMLGLSSDRPAMSEQSVQDPETEQIISYLSGKTELPIGVRTEMIREDYKRALRDEGVPVPETWDEWPLQRMGEYLENAAKNRDFQAVNKDFLKDPAWMDSLMIPKDEYDPALETAIRKLQRETGMPKIRWIDVEGNWGDAAQEDLTPDRGGWYEGISNTIRLRPPTMYHSEFTLKTLVAEQAHAKQRNENPLATFAQQVEDMAKVHQKVAKGASYDDAQSTLYSEPGSVEYEAHTEIEPELRKQLPEKYDTTK